MVTVDHLTITSTLLGLLGAVCAIIFGYSAFSRNRKADNKRESKEITTIVADIGYIKAGVDEIKRKQDKQEDRHSALSERVASVEASAKQAHKRIDLMQGQNDGRE